MHGPLIHMLMNMFSVYCSDRYEWLMVMLTELWIIIDILSHDFFIVSGFSPEMKLIRVIDC